MNSLAELFAASGAPPAIQAAAIFAKKLDAIEEKLALLRDKAGLAENWLPQVERRNSAPRFSPVTWAEKFGSCNGQGDLNRFMGELAQGMDIVDRKVGELTDAFAPPPAPEEPKMTRAEWEAQLAANPATQATERRGPGRPRREVAA